MRYALVALLLAGCSGCSVLATAPIRDLFDDTWSDATRFVPDSSYRSIWRDVEDCSGLRGAFERVRWYRGEAKGEGAISDWKNHRIMISQRALDLWCRNPDRAGKSCLFTERTIGHEIAHELSRKSGHPMPLYSKHGPCAQVLGTMD